MSAKKLVGVLLPLALLLAVLLGLVPGIAQADPGPYIRPNWTNFGGDSFSSSRPLVAAIYFYWFDPPSGFHLNPTEHPDYWGNPYHPAMSYANPAWHAIEMARMEQAGIDICLPDYWGGAPGNDWWSNGGLDALAQGMAANTQSGVRNPKVGMFYDTNTLQGVNLSSPGGITQFYRTIRDFYSRVAPKRWARVNGRAIVWLYQPDFPSHITKQAFDEARRRFARDFGEVGLFFVGNNRWRDWVTKEQLVDLTYRWGAARQPFNGVITSEDVVSIAPGYNFPIDPSKGVLPRYNGETYRNAWRTALQTRKRFIFIESWGEWDEATSISPSLEHGWREWETTRYFSQIFHSR